MEKMTAEQFYDAARDHYEREEENASEAKKSLDRNYTDENGVASWGARFLADFHPTHRHIKSGGLYEIVGEATIEATMEEAIIYRSNHRWWIRPAKEFHERFELLRPQND